MRGLEALSLASLLPCLVPAIVLPPNVLPPQHVDTNEAPVVQIGLSDSVPKLSFAVPCAGCLRSDPLSPYEATLPFDFQAFPLSNPCGASNVSINGRPIAQEWNHSGTSASGRDTFAFSSPHDTALSVAAELFWISSCLFERAEDVALRPAQVAQALTVFVETINGVAVDIPSGFTVSFKQAGPPELLRLSVTPNTTANKPELAQDWRNPPRELRLIAPDAIVVGGGEGSEQQSESAQVPPLHQHIEDLKGLEKQAELLSTKINEKKQLIRAQTAVDRLSLSDELRHCDSLTCVVKAVGSSVHSAVKVVYFRFRPLRHGPAHSRWEFEHDEAFEKLLRTNDAHSDIGSRVSEENGSLRPGSPDTDSQTGRFEGSDVGASAADSSNGKRQILYTVLKVVAGLTCCAGIFQCVRRSCCNRSSSRSSRSSCCSARCRAERQARRDERRATSQYRNLERRAAWRDWWLGRDARRIQDYEEKRALIVERENALEDAMQTEIRLLHEAHGMVNSIVQAEEGRANCSSRPEQHYFDDHRQSHVFQTHSRRHRHQHRRLSGESHGSQGSRTTSLPEYQSDSSSLPPAYDSEGEGVVADGFARYRPVGADERADGQRHWTPGSSVIEVSPRPSSETLRRPGELGWADDHLTSHHGAIEPHHDHDHDHVHNVDESDTGDEDEGDSENEKTERDQD